MTSTGSLATRRLALVCLALAGLLVTGCQTAPPPPPPIPTGCEVGVLGDSLTVRLAPLMPDLLAERACTAAFVDARIGRTTAEGVAALRAQQRLAPLPAVLVVGLGTNDRFQQASFPMNVDAIMELAAGRPVVWIEVAHLPIRENLNAILRRKAQQYSNLTIMDWDAAYWANPTWRASDDIHLTDLGAAQRAEAIAAAARRVAK